VCTKLAVLLGPIRRLALATRGEPADLLAISCLAAFGKSCDAALIPIIMTKELEAGHSTPLMTTRLVALISVVADPELHKDIGMLLSRFAQGMPDLAVGTMEGILSSILASETPSQRSALTRVLRMCLHEFTFGQKPACWPIEKGASTSTAPQLDRWRTVQTVKVGSSYVHCKVPDGALPTVTEASVVQMSKRWLHLSSGALRQP
jgi:hypothetical protein